MDAVEDLIHHTKSFLRLGKEKAAHHHDTTVKIAAKGAELLANPRWNKGTAFTEDERKEFNLRGKLPYQIDTLEQQIERAYNQYKNHETDLQKNAFLQSLKAQNWILYYALLETHLKEMMPVVYTPTEADAIANYSSLFRRSEGLYLNYPHKDTMEAEFLDMIHGREVDLVVCSDAGAILGIGDQGVGGIGISSAKAVIYSLVGGVDPARTLAVTLDVGTDNQQLLKDPFYVGWGHKRIQGEEYDEFVDKFVQLVKKHVPHALLHFEDFGVTNAQRLLDKYRDSHAVFNDDVQGTGAITLATLLSAVGVADTKLSDQNVVVYGAGSAGLGIARQLRDAMASLDKVDKKDATKKIWLVDKNGLVNAQTAKTSGHVGWEEFAQEGEGGLLDVIKKAKATVLIGTSTQKGAFTEEIVKEMSKNTKRPVILPLSNPSNLVEVTPEDAMKWSDGKALIATGSPFPAVDLGHGKKAIIAECNNALIYPGLGFGAILSRSQKLTDNMLVAGTRRLAELSPALQMRRKFSLGHQVAPLLPDFDQVPQVNFEVALAVAEAAIDEGVARVEWGKEKIREEAEKLRWRPVYSKFVYDPEGLH